LSLLVIPTEWLQRIKNGLLIPAYGPKPELEELGKRMKATNRDRARPPSGEKVIQ